MENTTLPFVISEAAILSLPKTAFYIPNFVTETEEKIILDKVRY